MTIARGGRLPDGLDRAMEKLNTSVDVDSALWPDDIQGSIAHARGLGRSGVLSPTETETIVTGLERIREEIEQGRFVWDRAREDVHMNIEARLVELVGPVGGKLHTGRSRNDQIATDLRLYCRRRGQEALASLERLARAIVDRAEGELDTLMPAYTHLQRAQPSRLSHHLLAWQELLRRDRGRLEDALRRANESPLGAGAVAGSGFPLDREGVARELGFAGPMQNSIDATGSRDFLMEIASALSILGMHLSRVGEEIVLWSSVEFGFMTLSDAFSTSSSMMPQKKNPDVAELVRGKSARILGSLTALLVLEKSLCFGYGRDLQEDKEPIFDAFDAAIISLDALAGAISTATFRRDRMRAALLRGHLCATDVADFLASRGVPFREAHHVVGALVREADTRGVELSELPESALVAAHPLLTGPELKSALDPEAAVERRALVGGPAKPRVEAAIAAARAFWSSGQS
ncbi:MAG: argininosuccinate lyase [Myxococcota bacterium]|jgi:argininosuccinate lyase|nr:argininosuccinate lyase [Myxococcota bacterium]